MMTAKFNGRCVLCHGDILVGAPINWARGFGASHLAGMCSIQPINATPTVVLPALPATVLANASAIVALLTFAQTRGLKVPKLRFLAPDGASEMRLSLASGATRYPGAVQVKVKGEWVGRINADGSLTGRLVRDFVPTLTVIAADPAAAAKAYGSLMCRCSVCNLPLTDAGSVEVGYGPICADRMGWAHTPKGTPSLTAVAHV